MTYEEIFARLWQIHTAQNPSAKKVYELFTNEGETVDNDHVAFRTFGDQRVNVEVMARIFESVGYKEKEEYHFEKKKLRAKHYENTKVKDAPKVFISELKLNECSDYLQTKIQEILNSADQKVFQSDNLIFSAAVWGKPSYETYLKIREESEYAAWLYVYGFRPNHFTVSINSLQKYDTIEKVNQFIKDNGFKMNSSGGEIKGSPELLLQQSSIMADIIEVEFQEGEYEIPACYYEFAKRFKDKNGNLYNGFHAMSADKIFESTDYYKK
jgi:hypothetical protein